MNLFIELVILIPFTYLAFWQEEEFLFVIMGFTNIICGLNLGTVYEVDTPQFVLGMTMIALGFYCLFRAVIMAWKAWKKKHSKRQGS